jgi:radical SAM superfamily enzyme YgiQ (UPF0313 family)
MHIILCDTRKLDVSKDFAGGMGVGLFPAGGGLRGWIIRHGYRRDRRPVALLFAHLAAIFRQQGHQVEYCEDRPAGRADLYVFCPALVTLHVERQAMTQILEDHPHARILVVGTVASVLPEAFSAPGVTVVKGEAEQLLWKLDEVLQRPDATVQLGTLDDLDRLPWADWSLFGPHRFRIGYDFWRFPTAFVEASRGCTHKCSYCPDIVLENTARFRDPDAVAAEIRSGIERWGFRSFKFRDPLFGLDRLATYRLAELLGKLPVPIQFSVETRIDLLRPELLRVLRRVGLTSVTVGIETPDAETLRQHRRIPVDDDRQRDFIALCRGMGIRTVASFMIGFPGDTVEAVKSVCAYAIALGPTFANFNIVTPYPGTELFRQLQGRIADFDFSHYSAYTPLLQYDHLTPEKLRSLHQWCARRFYFRWDYLGDNLHLLWPSLQKIGLGREKPVSGGDAAHPFPPKPLGTANSLRKKGFRQDRPH